jgi:hypothetical protein
MASRSPESILVYEESSGAGLEVAMVQGEGVLLRRKFNPAPHYQDESDEQAHVAAADRLRWWTYAVS